MSFKYQVKKITWTLSLKCAIIIKVARQKCHRIGRPAYLSNGRHKVVLTKRSPRGLAADSTMRQTTPALPVPSLDLCPSLPPTICVYPPHLHKTRVFQAPVLYTNDGGCRVFVVSARVNSSTESFLTLFKWLKHLRNCKCFTDFNIK